MTSSNTKVSPFLLRRHLSAAGHSHTLHCATIICDGHLLNGKEVLKESKCLVFNTASSVNKKRKAVRDDVIYYLNEPKSPMFSKIELFFDHYLIPH